MGVKVIKVEWDGKTGTINEDEAFIAAERIEEHVPVFELAMMLSDPARLQTAKLSRAYAALCDVAGIKASAKDIRAKMAASFGQGETAQERGLSFVKAAGEVISPLLVILTDGADMGQPNDEAQDEGNPPAPTS